MWIVAGDAGDPVRDNNRAAVPEVGGETQFADMYSAYDLLPAAMKARIEGRRAVHNFDFSRTRRHGEEPLTAEQKGQGAANRESDRAHTSRYWTQGDISRRSHRVD